MGEVKSSGLECCGMYGLVREGEVVVMRCRWSMAVMYAGCSEDVGGMYWVSG